MVPRGSVGLTIDFCFDLKICFYCFFLKKNKFDLRHPAVKLVPFRCSSRHLKEQKMILNCLNEKNTRSSSVLKQVGK